MSSSPSSQGLSRESSSASSNSLISTNSSNSTQPELTPFTEHKLYELNRATNNFSENKIIVEGEFSTTYEGTLDNGGRCELVAVKRYQEDGNIADMYQNELKLLSRITHPKLIALKGYCKDSDEFIIVHEFMKLGSLSDQLFGDGFVEEITLSWEKRLMICIDIAKALTYLHTGYGVSKRLIHGNVNPDNILLTRSVGCPMIAKLSEFGFTREGKVSTKSSVETDPKGKAMYIDPYDHRTGKLTRRSDVYSFGVVLLDVLYGKNIEICQEKKENLREWTLKYLNEGKLHQFVDDRIKEQVSQTCTLSEFAKLASSCLQDSPDLRPGMPDVLEKLEIILAIIRNTQT